MIKEIPKLDYPDGKNNGDLTAETFLAKHPCLPGDIDNLRKAYLRVAPDCTHPLFICSAILTHSEGLTIPDLTARLSKISQAQNNNS